MNLIKALAVIGIIPTLASAQVELSYPVTEYSLPQYDTASRLISNSYGNIGADLTGILQYPFENPQRTQLFLLGVGALILVDKELTSFYQDNVEPAFDGFSLPPAPILGSVDFSPPEDKWLILGLTSSYIAGVALNDERSQTAALLASKAMVYSYLTTHLVLKTAIGRKRPVPNLSTATGDQGVLTTDPFAFGYLHQPYFDSNAYGTSMPSYHFAQYFAVARVYSGVYDNSLIPYGVAALLSASNIRGHRHWVSDMVAGAAIGLAIGEVVMRNYDSTSDLTILPTVSSDGFGISITTSF